jgi:hypothetical protein
MTFIGMFGMAVCNGSAMTLTWLFPAILRSAACTPQRLAHSTIRMCRPHIPWEPSFSSAL